jgi:hypothetical protein
MHPKKRPWWFVRAVRRVIRLIISGAELIKKAAEAIGLYPHIKKIVAPYVPKVAAKIKAAATAFCSFLKSMGLSSFASPVCALQAANLSSVVLVAMIAFSFLALYGLGFAKPILRL